MWPIGQSRVWLLRTGIGMQRTRQVLRAVGPQSRRNPADAETVVCRAPRTGQASLPAELHTVIVFGVAGQLDPSAPVGNIVIPSFWRCQSSGGTLACSPELLGLASRLERAWAPSVGVRPGGGLTLQRPALDWAERTLLRRHYPDATICDMETFAVIEQFPGADCLAVRIVSDDGSEEAFSGGADGRRSKIPPSQVCALLPGIRKQCATLALFLGDMVHALTAS